MANVKTFKLRVSLHLILLKGGNNLFYHVSVGFCSVLTGLQNHYKQVHEASRRPRWVWEPVLLLCTTGTLLPALQITLFFKQFSMTCLASTYCFQALFYTLIWPEALYNKKNETHKWQCWTQGQLTNTLHTFVQKSCVTQKARRDGKREGDRTCRLHKKIWQLTFWLINCCGNPENIPGGSKFN